jgi:type IV secretion system protein TrbL
VRAAICLTPQGCLREAAETFWGSLADAVNNAAGEMLVTLFGWWAKTPPLNLQAAYMEQAQQYVILWIAIPVAVLAMFAAVAWGVLGGGVTWAADITRGLLVFGIVTAGSIPVVSAVQAWSSALAKGLLGAVPARDVGSRYLTALEMAGTQAPMAATFWALLMFLAAVVQYLLMIFRDGALLVLTTILPLAAAGQFSRGSVLWLPKVVGWLLALIFFKPAAALIYFIGFNVLGQGRDLQTLATAVCIMIAAIFALPAMLGLVSFAVSAPAMNSAAIGTLTTAAGLGASLAQAGAVRGAVAAPSGAPPPRPPAPATNGGAAAAATTTTTTSVQGAKVP